LKNAKVTREAQDVVKHLSLTERVALEAKSWDEWALRQQTNGHASQLSGSLLPGMPITPNMQRDFPHPANLWIGKRSNARRMSSTWEFEYLAPMRGKTVLQLGGEGEYAIKFVLAGAAEAYCVDPSVETLKLGKRTAEAYGVLPKVEFVRGIAERLPFPDDFFDAVYGNAVLHHTLVDLAAREIYRVLKPGGRASFHDPLEEYALARLARKYLPYPGKGDEGVDCPHTYAIVDGFIRTFDHGEYRESELFGVPLELVRRVGRRGPFVGARLARVLAPVDEYLVRRVRPLRRFCKAIAIRVEKRPSAAPPRTPESRRAADLLSTRHERSAP
jgi:SAM-dependent methyltransferase